MIFLGDRIRHAREEKEIKQEVMAKGINVKKNTLSQYENNHRNPSIGTLKSIALYLNVSVDYLLGIEEMIQTNSKNLNDLIRIFNSLSEEKRHTLLDYATDLVIKNE